MKRFVVERESLAAWIESKYRVAFITDDNEVEIHVRNGILVLGAMEINFDIFFSLNLICADCFPFLLSFTRSQFDCR